MSLFPFDQKKNLLSKGGEVYYYDKIYDNIKSQSLFDILFASIQWKNDEAWMFGKHIITKRKVAWYGDVKFKYTYSKVTKEALLWTPELKEIRDFVTEKTGSYYNACLLNLYHSGEEGMAWHSDDEKELVGTASIASISLGAERRFSFKHKTTGEVVSLPLAAGSLLEMKGETQLNWLHRLPPTKKVSHPRINLTFRLMATK
jgi:alkylated DNA repair dioxygenase AlkB